MSKKQNEISTVHNTVGWILTCYVNILEWNVYYSQQLNLVASHMVRCTAIIESDLFIAFIVERWQEFGDLHDKIMSDMLTWQLLAIVVERLYALLKMSWNLYAPTIDICIFDNRACDGRVII